MNTKIVQIDQKKVQLDIKIVQMDKKKLQITIQYNNKGLYKFPVNIKFGNFLENDFWTPPPPLLSILYMDLKCKKRI